MSNTLKLSCEPWQLFCMLVIIIVAMLVVFGLLVAYRPKCCDLGPLAGILIILIVLGLIHPLFWLFIIFILIFAIPITAYKTIH
jgi:hypothetical protein